MEGGRANEGGSRKTLVEERFVNRLRQEVLPDVDGHARSHYSQRFTVQRTIETKTRGNTVLHVTFFSLSLFKLIFLLFRQNLSDSYEYFHHFNEEEISIRPNKGSLYSRNNATRNPDTSDTK